MKSGWCTLSLFVCESGKWDCFCWASCSVGFRGDFPQLSECIQLVPKPQLWIFNKLFQTGAAWSRSRFPHPVARSTRRRPTQGAVQTVQASELSTAPLLHPATENPSILMSLNWYLFNIVSHACIFWDRYVNMHSFRCTWSVKAPLFPPWAGWHHRIVLILMWAEALGLVWMREQRRSIWALCQHSLLPCHLFSPSLHLCCAPFPLCFRSFCFHYVRLWPFHPCLFPPFPSCRVTSM